MFYQKLIRFGLVLTAWVVVHSSARAQITVDGVTDRTPYTGSVSLRVPAQAGFTFEVLLNGRSIAPGVFHVIDRADYYDLFVERTETATSAVTTRLVRFIVRAVERSNTEDGLPAWTPYPTIPSTAAEMTGAQLEIITPESYPLGLEIPVVAWIKNAQGDAVRANGLLTAAGHPSIPLRRGVGSGFLAATNPSGALNYAATLPGLQTNKTVNLEPSTTWTSVSGTLNGNVVWGTNSRIAVTGNLSIPAGSSLTIQEGAVVRLNSGVNITNRGLIRFAGSVSRPVVFTPVSRAQPWGGFFLPASTSRVEGEGVIFAAACAVQSGFPGHRSEQPLFYLQANSSSVALTNAAAIYLAGQLHHSTDNGTPYATFTMVRSLVQRCTTAGEFNGSSLTFLQSALIEVPYEDGLFCDDPDCDHDGFYLNRGVHEVRDSLIGWLKDDCIDAGSGGGPSSVIVSNCWLEASYHEGLAWSERNRTTFTYDSVLINCGQGIEAGWSTGAPNNAPTVPTSPDCFAERILSTGNASGARFGDNYNWGYRGFLRVTNSLLLHNYRNIFGKTWNSPGVSWDTNSWVDRLEQMDFQGNLLSVADTNHPNNAVWNPATDAGRLAAHMTTPADAPVGIGLAVWPNLAGITRITNGVPVRLSSFTTNAVAVSYTVESQNGVLASGSLQFAPGETVKLIPVSLPQPQAYPALRVALANPMNGEITGTEETWFLNLPTNSTGNATTLVARGSVWRYLSDGGDQGTAWRALDFDDGAWGSGPGQLGYGETDQATPVPNAQQPTAYFRQRFNVADPSALTGFSLWMLRDDGGVVFLNGTEIFRSPNLPAAPTAITYDTLTLSGQNGENTIDTATLGTGALQTETNIVTVEIHQQSTTSSDLSFDFELLGNSAPRIEFLRFGEQLLLYWSDQTFALEQADAIDGPWTASNSASPVAVSPASPRFYRLRK